MSNDKEKNSTAKIAIWYIFSNIFVNAIGFLTTPIFSRILSKEEYGSFSNFLSWIGIIEIFSTLNIGATIARAKYEFDEEMDNYLSTVLIFSNIVTLLLYALVESNSSFFKELFSMNIEYIRLMFVYLFFHPAFTYLQMKHRIYQKYKFFVFFSISSGLIRTIISLVLVCNLENRLLARVVGDVLPFTFLNAVLWLAIIKKGKGVRIKYLRFALAISIPLIPHTLAGNLLSHADKIMITNFCSESDTALYSLAYSVSSTAGMLWTAMNQAWSPWLYDNMAANNRESIHYNSKIYLGIFSFLIIGVLLLAPEAVLILGGKAYYGARFVMPPVILGCAVQFVYGMYVNIEIFTKKTFQISVGTVFAGALNIILNYVFIPQFGYIAAAYTTLVGYVLLLVFHYIAVKKNKQYTDIYDTKFVIWMLIILSVIAMLALCLYNYNIVRYICIIIYGIALLSVLIVNRKKFISFLK